jgi:membrane-bound lytic murein transglycosylase B
MLALLAGFMPGCAPASGQSPAAGTPPADTATATGQIAAAPALSGADILSQAPTSFAAWLTQFRADALASGIPAAAFDQAMNGVSPLPRVIELDRRQPEGTITFATYVSRVVTPARIAAGRRHMQEDGDLLAQVAARYHVQPRFIVALWAVESSFGQASGDTPIIPALATLAYDGRRSSFFRGELLAALKIVARGDVPPERMKGSWAGAMGQCQFMPSSYLKYAVDFDGNGHADIWASRGDVLGSIAHYLATVGWNGQGTWGREVTLPAHFDASLADLSVKKPLSAWSALGVRRSDGGPLPAVALSASVVRPDGASGRAFLIYDNYRALMNWNRSTYFATSIGLLADAIGGEEGVPVAMAHKRRPAPHRMRVSER